MMPRLTGRDALRATLSTTFAALLYSACCPILPAQADDAFQALDKPDLTVSPAAGPIHIDGVLDEAAWQSAAHAGGFCEITPGDNCKPGSDTEAWITYDENNLYLAFRAKDDPKTVRASLRDRDQIFADDWIGIILDTYGDAAWAYELFFNPLGIAGDLRWTPNGEDISFDLVMQSRGHVTADGYDVEVAVPFASLRFPEAQEQNWRATFLRTHPRDSRRQYSWASVSRDNPCFPCQFGTLKGIRGVRRATNIEVLPSVTGSQLGQIRDEQNPRSGLFNEKADADVGLGLRYSLTSSMVADATLNPDFSQIEADARQIDVNSTFTLFYPERRPFFQEGSDLFETYFSAVHSRTIQDPIVAGKLTGKLRRMSVGFITARDEETPIIAAFEEDNDLRNVGRSYSNILRVKQSVLSDSHVGLILTDRRYDEGGSGSLGGFDGSFRFRNNLRFQGQVLATHTRESDVDAAVLPADRGYFDGGHHTREFDNESFWGYGWYAALSRDARTWNFSADYRDKSPTFRTANGFVTQNDNRNGNLWSGLTYRPNGKVVEQVQPSASVGRVWNTEGVRKDEWLRPQLFMRMKKQTQFSTGYLWSNELFRGTQVNGIHRLDLNLWCDGYSHFQPGVYWTTGTSVKRFRATTLGSYNSLGAWADLKPTQRLVISPTYDYAQLTSRENDGFFFRSYVARTKFSYQFTRELFMRLVVQYSSDWVQLDSNGLNSSDPADFEIEVEKGLQVDPLLTYRVNPFTVFYLGTTHQFLRIGNTGPGVPQDQIIQPEMTQTERVFFMKLQYLFRV